MSNNVLWSLIVILVIQVWNTDQQNANPNTSNILIHIRLLHGSNVKTHMCILSLSANFMDECLEVMLMVMYFTILINPLSPTRREPRLDPTPLEALPPTPSCSAPISSSTPPEGSSTYSMHRLRHTLWCDVQFWNSEFKFLIKSLVYDTIKDYGIWDCHGMMPLD